jgi:predicted metal-dependent phosphoesterase TrpH
MTKYIIIIFCLVFFFILPASNKKIIPIDLLTGLPAEDFYIVLTEDIFEPFIGLSNYFLNFYNIKLQLKSWLLWLLLINIFIGILKNKKIINIFKSIFFTFIFFYLFLVYTIYFNSSFPYKVISKNSDLFLLDIHSHTLYSHDGLSTLKDSYKWHLKSGFDGYFITDHNNNLGVANSREIFNKGFGLRIFFGEEIQDKNGVNLLILGLSKTVSKYMNNETEKIVDIVHKDNGIVIAAHIWHKKRDRLEELSNTNIDGFEIYGRASTPLDKNFQLKIINFCKKNNLIMLAGSNRHGWSMVNNLWTGVYIPGWQKLDNETLQKMIINYISKKQQDKFRVFVLEKKEKFTELRYIFEPFIGLFYYFSNLTAKQFLTWVLWITIAIVFIEKYRMISIKQKNILKLLAYLLIAFLFFFNAILFFIRWCNYRIYNKILFTSSELFFISGLIFISLCIIKARDLYLKR